MTSWRRLATHPWFVGLAVLVCLLVCPARVGALELDDDTGLITETVASRERLRDYDNIKQYGAETINDRNRRRAQATGARMGPFLVFPTVDSKVIFDDNIFGAAKDAVSDFRFEVAPEVRIQSHLPRHILNMAFGANLVKFAENTDQDFTDFFANLDGGLHIDHAHTLGLSLSSELRHEERSDVASTIEVGESVPVFHHQATVGITRDVGRLHGTLSLSAERFDYQDSRSLDGSTLNQDRRDTDILNANLRTGYRFSPGYELVAKVRLLRQLHAGDGEDDLDAIGYDAVAGLAFETNPLLRWRVLGGYGVRDFDALGVDNIQTGLLEAQLEWLPTQRITIVGAASREFVDTIGLDDDGRIETSVSLRADIELLNNLVLSIGGEATDADFNGFARNDRTYSAQAELQYYLNKNLILSLGYEHLTRDSDLDAFDLERNRFMVGAKWKY